ncbi:mediator of DNA damage checkpoint protein 1 [Takifugu rubripes]|nr:mediator of DNA damage checkpoint protein 1 [Takifugu rubripes]
MDATQMINDSVLESDEEENEANQPSKGRPVAKLLILKNDHMPETELPLFLGENVLGRDGNTCTVPLPSPSISKQHATVSISLYRSRGESDLEALVWDLGSLNGTRKGRLKLTPNVRYALVAQDSLVLADIPCQFVSCSADTVSAQHNFQTPVSRSSLADASNEKGSGTDVGGEKSERVSDAKVSSPVLKDTKNTPMRTICLSFEQTPTQPEGTLVPESESDEEREGRANRRQKTLDSDSDLNKSSPTCSNFLTPTNKTVPESEDESPITPPFSTKNRPHRHVGFNKGETNINMGRQQLKEKPASEKEEEHFSMDSGPRMQENQETNAQLKYDNLPVAAPSVTTDAFQMDSDTDLEGEEDGVATLTTNQIVDGTSDKAQFCMESDTDVEEDAHASRKVPGPASLPENNTKPLPETPVFRPVDSDTDVDDDDTLGAASKAKPTSVQSRTTADSTPTTHLKQFHSDSDAESEEDDMKRVPSNSSFKISETPAKLAKGVSAVPPCPGSETHDDALPAIRKSGAAESWNAADTRADLDILSDSDTDAEHDSPLVKQTFVGTNMSLTRCPVSEAIQSDSDADTDVEESTTAPVLGRVTTASLQEGGEKDVEVEVNVAAPGEGHVPRLVREETPGLLNPSYQHCSTPVQLPENQVEDMETQAFLSPTSVRYTGAPALRTQALDLDSDSQEEENIVVAETQSFVLQTRACRGSRSEGHIREATQTSALESADDEMSKQSCREESFQLGLSESSHIQDPAAAADMESTQAFVSVEATQLYAATSSTSASELHAAPADGDQGEEPATGSAVPEREGWENLALEATQAYLSDPYHDSEEETDDEETQPFHGPASATLAMAETQPMCAFEEEDIKHPVSTAVQVKVRAKNETEERAEHSEAAVAQGRPLKVDLSLAETQPMCTSDDRESDDEDSFPGLRKGKTKQLQIEDEQTQPLTSSEQSAVETQPLQTVDQDLAAGGSEAFHQDNPVAAPRREVLQFKEEKPAALISSDLSTAETQLMTTGDDEESDEADAVLALPRRKAKPLQHQEDETQPAVCEPSVFQSRPLISGENHDGVGSLPGTEMTKVKPSQILEERIQLLTNSTSSTHETGVLETKADAEAGTSGSKVNGRRGTRANLRKVSTQCDEPSRRPTRGIKDSSAAARRGTSKSGEEKDEELEDKEEEHNSEAEGIQSRNDVDVLNKTEQNISQIQKQQEPSLGEQRGGTEPRQHENMEKERKETEENKRTETEPSNRLEWERAEKEQTVSTKKKDREDKERLEHDKAEREEKERLEKEKNVLMANRQTEQEKEMLESERRKRDENLGREDQQRSARQDSEAKGADRIEASEKEQLTEEKTVEKQEQKEENKAKVSARGRRAAQRTAVCKTEPVTDTCVSTNDDVPARRTRSRSNSSNSVSSERSALSINLQEGGRRGARRTSEPPRVVASRSSTRRKTVAARPTQGDRNDDTGITGAQGQARGSRQRTRGGKAEAVSPAVSQSDPKTVTRGRKNTKAQSSNDAEKAGSQQATTSRGQRRSSSNGSGPTEAKGSSNQGELIGNEETLQSKKNVRGRSHKPAKREAVVAPQSPAVSSPGETKELRKGRKRGSEANTDIDSDRSSKFMKGGEIEQTPGEAEEAPKQAQDETPAPAKRRSRASVAQTKKALDPSGPGLKETNERIAEEPVEKRGRGRLAVGQKQKREEQEGAEVPVEQRARVLEAEVQTPASSGSRKRQAPVDASPFRKTPRASSLSPAAHVRSRAVGHAYKVLFTGVVDEAGEQVLARLGGSVAKGVADMNCLVTDKLRRTVKLLCAVAKGIPVVTTLWLEKSGKTGSFLSPSSFIVKDLEQEKKFNFCLQESLKVASSQPLLQGYEIHVTKSVKPEPVQMRDILTCSGATFLPKMPSSHKAQTVVISCEEDWHLCARAASASVPVVTAEFILAGILQQKLDFQSHALSPPAGRLQPVGRARQRT